MAALTIPCQQIFLKKSWEITFRSVGPDDLGHPLAVLEEEEGGHGADGVLGGDIAQIVDIDLDKVDVGKLLTKLDNLGGDDLARTAPSLVNRSLPTREKERLTMSRKSRRRRAFQS